MNQMSCGLSPQVVNVIMSQDRIQLQNTQQNASGQQAQPQVQQTQLTNGGNNGPNDPSQMMGVGGDPLAVPVFKREVMDTDVSPY